MFSEKSRSDYFFLNGFRTNITLISKPGKDCTKKENYRPVSLININIKTLNNILASRIKGYI